MEAFWSFFANFFSWLYDALAWVLDGLMYVLKSFLYFPFDGLLTTIEAFMSALNFSSVLFTSSSVWGGAPPQMIWILNACGFPQCLSLVAAACLVRLTLNLIPSWATRV
jgi:hypothetical protein